MSSFTILKLSLSVTRSCRLDQAVLAALREQSIEVSRNRLKEFFREHRVREGGQPRAPSWMLNPGRYEVVVELNPLDFLPETARASSRGSFLPVIYEDEDLLVLSKASGIPSVPHSSTETETAVGAALARIPALARMPLAHPLEPGLLHRLDNGTSGLLAFAKTPDEFQRLKLAWRNGRVEKIYRAWITGPELKGPPRVPQTLNLQMAHDARSARRMVALTDSSVAGSRKIRGKPLSTRTYLRRIHSTATGFEGHEAARGAAQEAYDVEVEITTGVMHQIRCTLASLGWPILGDAVYRGETSSRLWLHAWRLSLPLKSGVLLKLRSELPSGWDAPLSRREE